MSSYIIENDRMFFYDRFANEFDEQMNKYDLQKRLHIIFNKMLAKNELKHKKVLDAGCGTGWFSQKAMELGATVTSLDVGENLLSEVRRKCNSQLVKGNVCEMEFLDETFDYVISTEVIEHTANPFTALQEMNRVLKKDGTLLLTVPNRLWHFSVVIGNKLNLRPYEGYENWVGWNQLKTWMKVIGIEVVDMFGFHIVPFVFPRSHSIIDYFDRFGFSLGFLMLNIALKGIKKER